VGPPPDIDPSEKSLHRRSRCTLSQLCSGECISLKSYQKKKGTSPDDICPAYRGAPHTTNHLFCCPSAPMDLSVRDLWKRPRESNTFHCSLPYFDRLPPSPHLPLPPLEPSPMAQCSGLRADYIWQTNQPTRESKWRES
jgi:hypothetical protein